MSLAKSFVWISIAYVVALFCAAISLKLWNFSPVLNALAADIVATVVIFLFSAGFKNSSFYDAYWSIAPAFLLLFWVAISPIEIHWLRLVLVSAAVMYWSTRLTLNWAYHWQGMSHEDWRYIKLKNENPKAALAIDLLGIHVFPTLQVFAGMLPVYALLFLGDDSFNMIDILAAIVTFGAVTIQLYSDLQLDKFNVTKQSGDVIETGLWGWSRHPNYFGEWGFWLGLFLFGLAAAPAQFWWTGIGFIAMGLMFIFVSIPMMETRSLERRPAYQDTIDSVSQFLPLPPKSN